MFAASEETGWMSTGWLALAAVLVLGAAGVAVYASVALVSPR
jgi:hypothetical protein